MQIIGISGKAGAGKDWLAGVLGRAAGYKRWSFALPMKAAGFGTGFTREEVDVTKPPHVRAWLQHYGTEEHRDRYRLDFWLRCADYFLDHLEAQGMADRIVIPDVRFPNEVDWVHARGGKVVRLWHGRADELPLFPSENFSTPRPYPLAGTPAAQHISETALDTCGRFDLEIVNDLQMTEDTALRLLRASQIVDPAPDPRYQLPNYRLGPGGTKERGS